MPLKTEPQDGDICTFLYPIPCRFKDCPNKTTYEIVAVSQKDIKAVCLDHLKLLERERVFDFGHCPLCLSSVSVADIQNHLAVAGCFRPNFTPCWICTLKLTSNQENIVKRR